MLVMLVQRPMDEKTKKKKWKKDDDCGLESQGGKKLRKQQSSLREPRNEPKRLEILIE